MIVKQCKYFTFLCGLPWKGIHLILFAFVFLWWERIKISFQIKIRVKDKVVVEEKMVDLRDVWEETSFQLEKLQSNPKCVKQEQDGLKHRRAPPYKLTFNPDIVHIIPPGENYSTKQSSALFGEERKTLVSLLD